MFSKTLLEKFLAENEGKFIRIFLVGGFQLRGKLEAYDEEHMKIYTDAYDSISQSILVPYTAVSTYVPSSNKKS